MQQSQPQTSSSALTCALLAVLAGAGLAGAAGVSLAAIAAHKLESPSLATAATMLIIHAAAVIGVLSVTMRLDRKCLWIIAAAVMLAAAAIFSGAISYQAFMGEPLIKGLAPVGGTALIASWVAVALLSVREALRK